MYTSHVSVQGSSELIFLSTITCLDFTCEINTLVLIKPPTLTPHPRQSVGPTDDIRQNRAWSPPAPIISGAVMVLSQYRTSDLLWRQTVRVFLCGDSFCVQMKSLSTVNCANCETGQTQKAVKKKGTVCGVQSIGAETCLRSGPVATAPTPRGFFHT